jgi:serine/threonine protein kinase
MCKNDGVIRLVDSRETQTHINIVMERATGGDLFSFLEKRDFELKEDEAKPICFQLATTL